VRHAARARVAELVKPYKAGCLVNQSPLKLAWTGDIDIEEDLGDGARLALQL